MAETVQLHTLLVAVARLEERLISLQEDMRESKQLEERIATLENTIAKVKWALATAWALALSIIGVAVNKLWSTGG